MSGWSATLRRDRSVRGYRKVLTYSRPPLEYVRSELDRSSPVPTAEENLATALREFKAINPDVWNGINDAYQALVDKKFASGLDPEEDARMERLGVALDRLMEPYDLARIEFIQSRSPRG